MHHIKINIFLDEEIYDSDFLIEEITEILHYLDKTDIDRLFRRERIPIEMKTRGGYQVVAWITLDE